MSEQPQLDELQNLREQKARRIEGLLNAEESAVIEEIRDESVVKVAAPGVAAPHESPLATCTWCHEDNEPDNVYCAHCGLAMKEGVITELKVDDAKQVQSKRVSSLGLAATAVSILLGLLFVASIVVFFLLPEEAEPVWYVLIALGWLALFIGGTGGVGLSIGAFFQRGRSRIFPTMGLFFNLLLIGSVALSMFIGLVFAFPSSDGDDGGDDYKFVRLEQTFTGNLYS